MQTQTQPTTNDREDARKAIDFYVKARTEHRLAPLDIILGIWGTPYWSSASKQLFLLAVRKRQECDRRGKYHHLKYDYQTVEQYYKMRLAYQNRKGRKNAAL